MSSRAAGVLLLVLGGGLTWWVWHTALTHGAYSVKLAVVGPMVLPLGVGFLIHGQRLPRVGVTPLMRVYGILGAIAAVLNLHLLGADRDTSGLILEVCVGTILIGIFLLPRHILEQRTPPKVAAKSPDISSDPIEPR